MRWESRSGGATKLCLRGCGLAFVLCACSAAPLSSTGVFGEGARGCVIVKLKSAALADTQVRSMLRETDERLSVQSGRTVGVRSRDALLYAPSSAVWRQFYSESGLDRAFLVTVTQDLDVGQFPEQLCVCWPAPAGRSKDQERPSPLRRRATWLVFPKRFSSVTAWS